MRPVPSLPHRLRGLAFLAFLAALLPALAALPAGAASGVIGAPTARDSVRDSAGGAPAEVPEASGREEASAVPSSPAPIDSAAPRDSAARPASPAAPARRTLPAAFGSPARARQPADRGASAGSGRPAASPSAYDPARERASLGARRTNFKSDFLLPGISTVLPGFGQYLQEDWSGFAYTGAAAVGITLFLQGAVEIASDETNGETSPSLSTESPSARKVLLGGMAYQGSGFLSAYSAFRISVPRLQAEDGKYAFLGRKGESVGDLMISPFRFGHLARPTTFIPLGLLAGYVGWVVADERGKRRDWTASVDDYLFTGALAWNAGVSEEAVFRGWAYPWCYENLGKNFWLANGLQAALFGLAHFNPGSNPVPWPQTVIGFYLGWLASRNQWTLSESIFVHAWWDMILFAGMVATQYREYHARPSMRIDIPIGW